MNIDLNAALKAIGLGIREDGENVVLIDMETGERADWFQGTWTRDEVLDLLGDVLEEADMEADAYEAGDNVEADAIYADDDEYTLEELEAAAEAGERLMAEWGVTDEADREDGVVKAPDSGHIHG